MVAYNNKKYYIDIVETKPFLAISIIETDCEVDFVQPLDYKELEKQASSAQFDRERKPQVEDKPAKKKAQFNPFTGSGRRLDGKPLTRSIGQTSSLVLKHQQIDSEIEASDSKPSNPALQRTVGKLLFGSNTITPPIPTPKAFVKNTNKEPSQKDEEPTFQAFTGKKYLFKG